jgi:hypothetical protein
MEFNMSKILIANLGQHDEMTLLQMNTQVNVTGGLMALPGECSSGTFAGYAFSGGVTGALGGAVIGGGVFGAVAGGVFGAAIGGASAGFGCAIALLK